MGTLTKTLHRVSWGAGLKSAFRTAWDLGVVIFPVTLAVSIFQYTAVYGFLLSGLTPVMGFLGLPNEAAVPLALGNLVGLYAGIGAMLTLELTVKEVFILALMLSLSHALPVESAVCRRIGVSALLVVSVRIGLALISAAAVDRLWSGGGAAAQYGLVSPPQGEPSGWVGISSNALITAAAGIAQLAAVVIPVMLMIQILKDLGILERFARLMRPLVQPLGIAPRGAVTMAGGLAFGLSFGAGVILEQVREHKFARRELVLIVLFLCVCHAVIEDTLIFIPLGINILPLLLIRLAMAVLLTLLIARLWRPPEKPVEHDA